MSCNSCGHTGTNCNSCNSSKTCNCPSCSSGNTRAKTFTISGDKEFIIKDCCGGSGCSSCSSSSTSCSDFSYCNKKSKKCRTKECRTSSGGCLTRFGGIINNISGLIPNPVCFILNKQGNLVQLQWEPFSGTVGANGVAYLSLAQSVPYAPVRSVGIMIPRSYNGTWDSSAVEISNDGSPQLKFYIQPSKDGSSVEINDSVIFSGGCITWITNVL